MIIHQVILSCDWCHETIIPKPDPQDNMYGFFLPEGWVWYPQMGGLTVPNYCFCCEEHKQSWKDAQRQGGE